MMAEGQMIVASAVLVPGSEIDNSPSHATLAIKRRRSFISEEQTKRPRAAQDGSFGDRETASPTSTPMDRIPERRASGQIEERKRGKRLFGALLGTLAQSSSSTAQTTAQKRRVEIEKKLHEKLKLQEEEDDEQKRQKSNALVQRRWREQTQYNRESMLIRHSNLLNTAHFLHTKAEPKLYYKPWELLPDEEVRIKSQIEEVEAIIKQELSSYENHNSSKDEEIADAKDENQPEVMDAGKEGANAVGEVAENTKSVDPLRDVHTNPQPYEHGKEVKAQDFDETLKNHMDDSGEVVVEGDEDTVIY